MSPSLSCLLVDCFLSCLGPPLLQAQLLRELEHRVTQDSVTRQQLEIIKTSGMEKLLEDVEQKEQQLQLLTAEAERASKLGQLRWRKMDRDLQQVRPAEHGPESPVESVEPEESATCVVSVLQVSLLPPHQALLLCQF